MTSSITGNSPDHNLRESAFPPGTLRVLQLTDTHLYANPVGTLLGINTLDSFQHVIRYFRDHHWPLDLLLATGDLVHDASPEGYALIGDMLAGFGVPVFCLPGNHDVPPVMREHLTGANGAHRGRAGSRRLALRDARFGDSGRRRRSSGSRPARRSRTGTGLDRSSHPGVHASSTGQGRQRLDRHHGHRESRSAVRDHRSPPACARHTVGPCPPDLRGTRMARSA